MKLRNHSSLTALLLLAACGGDPPPAKTPTTEPAPSAAPSASTVAHEAPPRAYKELSRAEFNRRAVRKNLPLFWEKDDNQNGAVDPSELRTLLFYGRVGKWVEGGAFTPEFHEAYQTLLAAGTEPSDRAEQERQKLVEEDLDQGVATLVHTDLTKLSATHRAFAEQMLRVSGLIDELYATQKGIRELSSKVKDPASTRMFARNWGPACVGPKTEGRAECRAVPGSEKPSVDVYPAELQTEKKFCENLEKHADAKRLLLDPFSVIRKEGGKLVPVPYHVAYKEPMEKISKELSKAADLMTDPKEEPLRTYLRAAATSFRTNQWEPADEAWSKMNAQNSSWYLRVGPDEVYWEPCSHKAGFHMTLARINNESLAWQDRLVPVQNDMEKELARVIGPAYTPRTVTFHLPDFIDITFNAGDDRNPMGGTIGQSLPNWGKVTREGRGRTVAMTNLYTDTDSLKMRRAQAESLLSAETMKLYADAAKPGLLTTILHEVSHNLGPTHEHTYKGKNDAQWFGGELSSMMEELKAQTGGLLLVPFLEKRGLITNELAKQTYVDSVVWAFGHVSRGMVTASGKRKPYSQLAAIQLGFFLDEGAVSWDPNAPSADGKEKGAFTIHFDKFPTAVEKLMKQVGGMKATGDRKGAEALAEPYIRTTGTAAASPQKKGKTAPEGERVPHAIIRERTLRQPKASFVYSLDM